MKLPKLKAGDSAIVAEIIAPPAHAKRLADLGFIRGAKIEMIQPGEPCIVRVDQARIGLAGAHQAGVWLRVP